MKALAPPGGPRPAPAEAGATLWDRRLRSVRRYPLRTAHVRMNAVSPDSLPEGQQEALRVLRSLAQASDGALTVDLDYEYLAVC